MDLYKRVSFPMANEGLALRCIDSVYLTAFACSMASSSLHLSHHFPEWIQTSIVDNVHQITSINEKISPYTIGQIMYCVQKLQSKVSNGSLEGLNSLAPIFLRRSNQNDRSIWLPHYRLQERRKRHSLTWHCRWYYNDTVPLTTGSFSSSGTYEPFFRLRTGR